MPDPVGLAGSGVYIHWPWCLSKCPYCDFNSHVAERIDQTVWVDAYLRELERYAAESPDMVIGSIFFGGGTPSLMDVATVGVLVDAVVRFWRTTNKVEITLEANPTSVEVGKFQGFLSAGVNRVSLGLQALDDHSLKLLGRMHSAAEGLKAFEVARSVFDRASFDLIYARQGQSLESWCAELGRALDLQPDHLSLYQLTIEEGTVFAARHAAGKLPGLPESDLSADMYLATRSLCENAGLPAYEVSNHARPGQESRHNLVYWRGGNYVGVGPGAHGRLNIGNRRVATEAHRDPGIWFEGVKTGAAESARHELTPADIATEYLMMSLRLPEGTDLERLGQGGPGVVNHHKIKELEEIGLVSEKAGRLAATPDGMLVLNAILRELLV